MQAFWAIMHLVAAALTTPSPNYWCVIDAAFRSRESDYDEAKLVAAYASSLGMPADEAWALALCRGDRREAFEG